MDDIARASQLVGHVMTETKLHIKYCESFGITRPEILATEEHQGLPFAFTSPQENTNTLSSMHSVYALRLRYRSSTGLVGPTNRYGAVRYWLRSSRVYAEQTR